MNLSEHGIRLIKNHEGLRLKAYLDAAGVWTIGYGSTGPHVKPDLTITEDRAEELLRKDLERFENAVGAMVRVPLKQREFDALVSLCYNIGTGALSNSTLLRKLNAGDRIGATQEFVKWVNAGGKPLLGLLRRRLSEASLFIGS